MISTVGLFKLDTNKIVDSFIVKDTSRFSLMFLKIKKSAHETFDPAPLSSFLPPFSFSRFLCFFFPFFFIYFFLACLLVFLLSCFIYLFIYFLLSFFLSPIPFFSHSLHGMASYCYSTLCIF